MRSGANNKQANISDKAFTAGQPFMEGWALPGVLLLTFRLFSFLLLPPVFSWSFIIQPLLILGMGTSLTIHSTDV